ncbi:MAG: hypothetical protein ABIG44_08210 [Planctomycetota bacterium]
MIAIVMICLLGRFAEPVKPEALRNFEHARQELRTGRISCIVTNGPKVMSMPVMRYGMEIAKNGDVLHSYDGDPEGIWSRDENGYPMLAGSTLLLVENDTAWLKHTWDFGGTIVPDGSPKSRQLAGFLGGIVDLRTLGMAPDWDGLVDQTIDSILDKTTRDCAGYSTEQEGSLHRVIVHYADDRVLEYEIDAAKGWNATRISGSSAGNEWENIIELREAGGTWFPERTALYVNGSLRTECVVSEAAFNSPGDPAGWTVEDIGFEVGMYVHTLGQENPESRGNFWDGCDAIPYEQMKVLFDSGELSPGPTLELMQSGDYEQPGSRLVRRLRISPGVLTSFLSTWELYVIDFCDLHGLNREQVERAYRCLRGAQERGHQYLTRRASDFASLQKKQATDELSTEQAQARFEKLRKPVDDIFEKELKPCLEKIPTREQRDGALERSKDRIHLFAKPRQPNRTPPEPPRKRP